jgi:hypothetical protein
MPISPVCRRQFPPYFPLSRLHSLIESAPAKMRPRNRPRIVLAQATQSPDSEPQRLAREGRSLAFGRRRHIGRAAALKRLGEPRNVAIMPDFERRKFGLKRGDARAVAVE